MACRFLHDSKHNSHQAEQQPPVTVVVMNWARPDNVKRIALQMAEYPEVQEVVVAMCNPETAFELTHDKVKTVDYYEENDKWGVALRFRACERADTELVLVADDDLIVLEDGLHKMIAAKMENPDTLVSYVGREIDWDNMHYLFDDTPPGRHPIALTRALMVDRRFCRAFFALSPLVADIVNTSSTLWNGEDIFMSLIAQALTHEVPLILDKTSDTVEEIWDGRVGISVKPDHIAYRSKFLQHAVEQLQSCKNSSHHHLEVHINKETTKARRQLHALRLA